MGTIHPDVLTNHLAEFAFERPLIASLLGAFSVDWARHRRINNASVSAYLLSPEPYMAEAFGFGSQIALFIPHEDALRQRTMQAIATFLDQDPFKWRADRSSFVVIHSSRNAKHDLLHYIAEHNLGWVPIVLSREDLGLVKRESWHLRNVIAEQLFIKDLFDDYLPLTQDAGFFGRDAFVLQLKNAIKNGNNHGLFGLRKTGKTSILFKLARDVQQSESSIVLLHYDCKMAALRKKKAEGLIDEITMNILEAAGKKPSLHKTLDVYKRFERVVGTVGKDKKICLVFDEVEYLSFLSPLDLHWRSEYFDFWQTLWSIQSSGTGLTFIIAGVNATVLEQDKIDGIQNPLFGIVPFTYVQGLELIDLRRMLRHFGKRMGLRFEEDAIQLLFERYGGHPLMTRKACSFLHRESQLRKAERPLSITSSVLESYFPLMDENNRNYFEHVLSEVELFYPDEYELLCMAVSGEEVDFVDLADDPKLTKHLTQYGILELSDTRRPSFRIASLRAYLARETARREKRLLSYRLIAAEELPNWVRSRAHTLVKEFRHLNRAGERHYKYKLYADGTLGTPEDFTAMPAVGCQKDLEQFLSTCYKSMVEPIDRAGERLRKQRFFWTGFATDFPSLQRTLRRIRCYRHWFQHTELKPEVERAAEEFLRQDFGQVKREFSPEEAQALQQLILDDVFLSVQQEIFRVSED